jgi:hypothetical protein
MATAQQSRFLFSEKATKDFTELSKAAGIILLGEYEWTERKGWYEALDNFVVAQGKVYIALYNELGFRVRNPTLNGDHFGDHSTKSL